MACRKAVLSSADDGNFIDPGLRSWSSIVLVMLGNEADVSDALPRLLSDRTLREDIGKNTQSFVREHFAVYAMSYAEVAKG